MLTQVGGIIGRYRMLAQGQRVGVAVSGGADSVCLLHALLDLAPSLGLELTVLHVDHGLRGDASRADAEFVRELAAAKGLAFEAREVNLAGTGNLEEAGREARLGFFREFLRAGTLNRIALGHTLDDQAETVLYRLLRGSGSAGLCGIRPVTPEGIVRPLIGITRSQVEQYLAERDIPWREDATNSDRSFVRNRIRHDLLPALAATYNPSIRETLARTALLSLEDEQFFTEQIGRLIPELLQMEDGSAILECESLTALPAALARRLLRQAVAQVKGDVRSVDFDHIEKALALASSPDGSGRLQIAGVDVFRSFEWLRLARRSTNTLSERDFSWNLAPPVQLQLPAGAGCLEAQVIEDGLDHLLEPFGEARYNTLVSDLDWDKVVGRLELRNWRPGDQYRRVGRDAPERIKFLFQEARIPLWKRGSWPIITDGDVILWARQFGPAAEFAATGESRRILRIKVTAPGS